MSAHAGEGARIFNIASQHGMISNVAGDQHLQYAGRDLPVDIGATVAQLRRGLAATPLTTAERRQAAETLDQLDGDLAREQHDRRRIAHRVERLTATLSRAGGLAATAAELRAPLERLAMWLGGFRRRGMAPARVTGTPPRWSRPLPKPVP
jgi:hypothetical protein